MPELIALIMIIFIACVVYVIRRDLKAEQKKDQDK